MNIKSLLPFLIIGGALYMMTRKSTGSISAHSSGTYRLQFPATTGDATTPAHPDLYSRDEDTSDGSTLVLYAKTPSGNYTATSFLLDTSTGSLIG